MQRSLFLLIALVCGTVATVIANQWLTASSDSETTNTTEIFVASVEIDIGQEITPEKVRLEQWPADKVPEGASSDFDVMQKKYARQRLYQGEAIMPIKLMDENWTTVPKGYSVVAMKASSVSIANLIQPGDRVDVLAYFEKSEIIPRTMTKTVLTGVRVYALDGDTERRAGEDRHKRIENIQLLINKVDLNAWSYAGELGSIQLALGSDADHTTEDGSNEAAKQFIAWLEEHRAAREEAIRQAEEERRLRGLPPTPEVTEQSQTEAEEGFTMMKLVEGRMIEYWIVPGKMPRMIGVVGGDDENSVEDLEMDEAQTTKGDEWNEAEPGGEYGYLNGEDSPLFQPPTNRRSQIHQFNGFTR